jgi:outer membrane protein OmpA-like peptidoglycan-associated protein
VGAKYTSNRVGGTGDDDIYTSVYDSVTTNNVVQVLKLDSNVQKSFSLGNTKQVYHFHFDQSLPIENSNLDSSILSYTLENTDSYIQLNCHTDLRGTEKYNQKLSEKRGEEIKNRLISSGIPENQITIQSLGESSPVIECTDCSEKEHAENRVVILSIKKRDKKDAL